MIKILLLLFCITSSLFADLFQTDMRYFVMASDELDGETVAFVVPVAGQYNVDAFRRIVTSNKENEIVYGFIALRIGNAGADTVNRDYLGNAAQWSWEVKEFIGFYDYVPGIGSSWVSYIEEDVSGYVASTYGLFMPRSAQLIGELPINPDLFLAPNLKKSNWFGRYDDRYYPWVYNYQAGWVYVSGFDPDSIWMYTYDKGWFWTSEGDYPFIWVLSSQSWDAL